jgi:hypothetical protein
MYIQHIQFRPSTAENALLLVASATTAGVWGASFIY